VDWNHLIESLVGSSPVAGVLGFACYYLAGQVKEARAETAAARAETAAVRAELATAQDARIDDLKSILKPKT